MAKFFLTNKAVEDLSEIWDYPYETWSEMQADKYYSLLIDTSKKLPIPPASENFIKRLRTTFLDLELGDT